MASFHVRFAHLNTADNRQKKSKTGGSVWVIALVCLAVLLDMGWECERLQMSMGVHLLFGVSLFCLAVVSLTSLRKVRKERDHFGFVYPWAFWLGAFIWEDLFVFSLYHFGVVTISWLLQDVRIGLLMVAVFWIVRSSGEALYFFLQQFFRPTHHPHAIEEHFSGLSWLFGEMSHQKGSIILQVIHQTVVMIALGALSLLFLNWQEIPRWW